MKGSARAIIYLFECVCVCVCFFSCVRTYVVYILNVCVYIVYILYAHLYATLDTQQYCAPLESITNILYMYMYIYSAYHTHQDTLCAKYSVPCNFANELKNEWAERNIYDHTYNRTKTFGCWGKTQTKRNHTIPESQVNRNQFHLLFFPLNHHIRSSFCLCMYTYVALYVK